MLPLDAMEELVGSECMPFPDVTGKRPRHLRPINARPGDRGVCYILNGRESSHKDTIFFL